MVVAPLKPRVNRTLISLKVVVFFVISGISALHILHATKPLLLGLNFEEYRCISILAPFISIIGPLIAGPLADRLAARNANNFGRVLRILTAVFLILSAFVYSFLFFIPEVHREEARTPAVNFGCDANGAFIFQERCYDESGCYHWTEKVGSLKLTNCTYTCQDTAQYENMYTPWMEHLPTPAPSTEHSAEFDYDDDSSAGTVTESLRARREIIKTATATIASMEQYAFGGGEEISAEEQQQKQRRKLHKQKRHANIGHRVKRVENSRNSVGKIYVEPPHLCITQKNELGVNVVKNCHVYTDDTHHIVVHGVMHGATNVELNDTHSGDWCNYPLDGFQCQVPALQVEYMIQRKNTTDCRPMVQCQVIDPYEGKDSLLMDSKCVNITGDLDATLDGYMAIRLLGDIFPMAVLTLLNTAIVIAVRETSEGRGEVCRQYAWGALGYVLLFSPFDVLFFSKENEHDAALVALIIVIVCFFVGAIVLIFSSNMPLSPPEWWWHTKTGVLVYPMSAIRRYKPEILLVTLVAILFGTFWSSIHSYLLWTFTDPYAVTFSALLLVCLFFFNVDKLIEYCGHSNIFIAGFAIFIIRFTALNMLNDAPWLTIVMEIIEPAIIGLLWLTIILYMRHVVPRKFTATGQGIAVVAFFGLGKGFGALIGLARDEKTTQADAEIIHQWLAMASCLIAVTYFIVYNLLLAPRCTAKPQHADDLISGSASQQFVGTNGSGGNGTTGTSAAQGTGTSTGPTNNGNGNYSPLRVYHNERGKKGQFRF